MPSVQEAKDSGVPSRSSVTFITVVIDTRNYQRGSAAVDYGSAGGYHKSRNDEASAWSIGSPKAGSDGILPYEPNGPNSLADDHNSISFPRQEYSFPIDRRLILVCCLVFLGCLLLIVFGTILIRFRRKGQHLREAPINAPSNVNFIHDFRSVQSKPKESIGQKAPFIATVSDKYRETPQSPIPFISKDNRSVYGIPGQVWPAPVPCSSIGYAQTGSNLISTDPREQVIRMASVGSPPCDRDLANFEGRQLVHLRAATEDFAIQESVTTDFHWTGIKPHQHSRALEGRREKEKERARQSSKMAGRIVHGTCADSTPACMSALANELRTCLRVDTKPRTSVCDVHKGAGAADDSRDVNRGGGGGGGGGLACQLVMTGKRQSMFIIFLDQVALVFPNQEGTAMFFVVVVFSVKDGPVILSLSVMTMNILLNIFSPFQTKNRSNSVGDGLDEYFKPVMGERDAMYLSQCQVNRPGMDKATDIKNNFEANFNNYDAPGGTKYYNKLNGPGVGVVLQPGTYMRGGQAVFDGCNLTYPATALYTQPVAAKLGSTSSSVDRPAYSGYQTLANISSPQKARKSSHASRPEASAFTSGDIRSLPGGSDLSTGRGVANEVSVPSDQITTIHGKDVFSTPPTFHAWRKNRGKKGIVSSSFV
ncbi:unnamed protein product [Schistocephalus solidus]|uniref:Uncharacterized protein n=1 Tax=Schistocephalus solidus TaxID=70667 RepID=A0A183SFG5_SCHSO|nr:unnamed protein product [Schistocephalus solidus]